MYTIGIQTVKKGRYIEKIFPIAITSLEIATMKAKLSIGPHQFDFMFHGSGGPEIRKKYKLVGVAK